MEIKVTINARMSDVYAEGIYDGSSLTVLPGGTISPTFASHIKGGNKAKSYRDNSEYVDANRKIIKACLFSSPSTAAQFVTGRSANGYATWKVDNKLTLGDYLKKKGLR